MWSWEGIDYVSFKFVSYLSLICYPKFGRFCFFFFLLKFMYEKKKLCFCRSKLASWFWISSSRYFLPSLEVDLCCFGDLLLILKVGNPCSLLAFFFFLQAMKPCFGSSNVTKNISKSLFVPNCKFILEVSKTLVIYKPSNTSAVAIDNATWVIF